MKGINNMVVVTYEEKMGFLDNLLMRGKLLHETCEGCFPQRHIEILECIIEDVRDMHIINEEAEKFSKIEKKAEDIYGDLFLK